MAESSDAMERRRLKAVLRRPLAFVRESLICDSFLLTFYFAVEFLLLQFQIVVLSLFNEAFHQLRL
jgi:hypothetical protein